MGTQVELAPPPPLRLGEEVVVRHDGGASQTATFAGIYHNRGTADLRFGLSGVRTVRLRGTAHCRRGRFTEASMSAWSVDEYTLERLDRSS